MRIQILNVSVETKMNKSGKPYQIADIAFKNLTFQGKVEGKKLFDFGAQAEAYKVLVNATSGDVFDVNVVKNAQGYNDWTAVTRSTGEASVEAPTDAKASGSAPARTSNYETAEERATRQVLIVRQSSLSVAATALTTGSKTPPKPDEVIDYAKKLEKYVFGVEKPTNPFDDIPDFPAEAE